MERITLLDAVARALREAGDATDLSEVEIVKAGTSSVVALSASCAVRVARDQAHGVELLRTQRLVDSLPDLPFAVPRSTGLPVVEGRFTAVPTERVVGEGHQPGSGDAVALRELIDAIHSIEIEPSHPDLAERHAFMGGPEWESVLRERVIPALPRACRAEAVRRVDAIADLPAVELQFAHGDLAGANVLWVDGCIVGVIDWDLATYEDPAEDVASLAWWHGWNVVTEIAEPGVAERAVVYRDLFPIQMVAFQMVNDRGVADIQRVIDRVSPLLES